MSSNPPYRDVVFLGAGASIAGGLPTAAGFTKHVLAAREALAAISPAAMTLEAIDRDLAWLTETQEHLRPAVRFLRGFDPDNIEWIAHQRRFDEETPNWVTHDVFRGVALGRTSTERARESHQ